MLCASLNCLSMKIVRINLVLKEELDKDGPKRHGDSQSKSTPTLSNYIPLSYIHNRLRRFEIYRARSLFLFPRNASLIWTVFSRNMGSCSLRTDKLTTFT